ncbi:xanthine dehydrogenase family protein molybdopterin-binding subunit [Bradyrhizobium cenepequi]|uniref:xanthine dehydrogenase family protein molybdopterin-binding subunit n=1 Tax=Bradyrhizobium cenepequi TaxID=2821403 RepID=UPI001CE28D6A|nr:xanthine dehydrogenase family protein molybdopterin-binding subunit [Bradyrhizobium cenepequi]MCA6109560.1 xanthine dehydrogenase family protein molybdopterin-binding subunit [Bradyrhizobium cenepequi]
MSTLNNTAKTYTGTATSRVDGRAKVTGAAKYAGDFNSGGLAYGAVVEATIARGRIVRIDASEALRVPGVLDVITHENRPRVADSDEAWKDDVAPEEGSPFRPLYDDAVKFNQQPIALVLAEEWEIARYAASLVRVDYEKQPFVTDVHRKRDNAIVVAKPDKPRGDVAKAFAAAEVRHEADYFIPTEHHNPMELFASTAMWEAGGPLTVYDKTQGVQNVQGFLCSVFEKKPDEIRVISPYVGGAFGAGLRPQYQVVLAVMGALKLQRSVRLVLTRQQMYGLGYRPATIERLALGAQRNGTLDAITHEAIGITSQFEEFSRNDTGWSALLYASPNARYEHRVAQLDVPTSCDMRAPGAATGVYALESAMDELAVALKMDPVELRLRCYSDRDQNENLPYTSKRLRECYREGAAAFGWDKRQPEPRSMRDGKTLVGWGMASGVWEALQMPVAVRIVMTANGHAEVSCAASDIGTGTYTIMAQVAADSLGLPIENITIRLADSTLPRAPVEGGSWMAASACHAVIATASEVRKELLRLAKLMKTSPLADAVEEDVALSDGKLVSRTQAERGVSISDMMRHGAVERIEREKTNEFAQDNAHARNTHSAVFAEVKVDEELGVIRVTRVVSAVAAGRVLNPKTGRSQVMGAIVGGIGMALHEETIYDHGLGRIVNHDIAEYHVPVNADIHDIEVIFVDEPDTLINPLGMKGLGEIGIVGVAAAVANAVYHATGVRVRDLPITLDKVLTRRQAA